MWDPNYRVSVCYICTGQDFHRKLLSLYSYIRLAKLRLFLQMVDSHDKAVGPRKRGNYLSNVLSIQLENCTYFIKNDSSGLCA